MTSVVVDGVKFVPATEADIKPLVAIAITTRNRNDVLLQTLKQIRQCTPSDFPVFIVDDASTSPVHKLDTSGLGPIEHFRFDTNVGIPQAKNKCIELCMDEGAEHFFLLDDDCYPVLDGWWRPYVNSPEPHLNYIFTHWTNGTPVGDCREIYNDGGMRAFDQARGCAMYVQRSVIERVGGFRPEFGHGMNEHLEYSQRVNNCGLTTFAYADVVNGDDLWYSLDRAQSVVRTLPGPERAELLKRNNAILQSLQGSTDYVEYRDMPNVVATSLLTANADGQRGTKWAPDKGIIKKWHESISGAMAVVITDEIDDDDKGQLQFRRLPSGWDNPYLQRWASSLEWLKDHTAQWVWLTDGSDVEMLNEPWEHMKPGVLYVGDEPCTVAKPWLSEHHPFYRDWIRAHPNEQMLNCGVVGGDRATVLEFLQDMVRELAKAFGQIDYEMGTFNYLLRQSKWYRRIEHGPHVTTAFKLNERTDAWWKHK